MLSLLYSLFPHLTSEPMKLLSCVHLFVTPWTVALLHPWNFPGKSTGVGCHFLLQGIFLTEGSNPGFPHCRQTLPSEPPGKSSPDSSIIYMFSLHYISVLLYYTCICIIINMLSLFIISLYFWVCSLVAQAVKNLSAMQDTWFDCWVRKIPWRREWQPTPVFFPGEFHGHRILVVYSPWGHKESDRTEQLTLSFPGSSDSKESARNVGDPS